MKTHLFSELREAMSQPHTAIQMSPPKHRKQPLKPPEAKEQEGPLWWFRSMTVPCQMRDNPRVTSSKDKLSSLGFSLA